MHSSLILLTVVSLILIALMVTCFFCFIRSRRKEDEELMERVQLSEQQMTRSQQATPQRSQQKQLQQLQQPSNEILINEANSRYQQNQLNRQQEYRNSYSIVAGGGSPFHQAGSMNLGQQQQQNPATPRQDQCQSDITQQINSAIIGSSEAEFQNDFIQVFPMYQIAPQPEKNTTPYLT